MNLGRDQPNNFFGLGQDRPRRAGWASIGLAQHGQPSEGENYFSPPRQPPTCNMQEAKMLKKQKENAGERLRTWRGGGGRWWRCGGVASGRRLRAVALRLFGLLSLSLFPSPCFGSVFFLFLFLFSVLVSVFSSLSLLDRKSVV